MLVKPTEQTPYWRLEYTNDAQRDLLAKAIVATGSCPGAVATDIFNLTPTIKANPGSLSRDFLFDKTP